MASGVSFIPTNSRVSVFVLQTARRRSQCSQFGSQGFPVDPLSMNVEFGSCELHSLLPFSIRKGFALSALLTQGSQFAIGFAATKEEKSAINLGNFGNSAKFDLLGRLAVPKTLRILGGGGGVGGGGILT